MGWFAGVVMTSTLEGRRKESARRLDELKSVLGEAAKLAQGRACVYLTGSFARGEASHYSDLDLFIVGNEAKGADGEYIRLLSRLDEICIKADLIEATRKHGIPEFSAGGQYLIHYTVRELTETLGKPQDDAANTFTARLLLLLESRPLLGDDVYQRAISDVVGAYWGDFERHKSDFVPSFVANDILRLWRTFCVNYEARTSRGSDEKNAKRKLKNFKLKHSRLLTCFSGIVFLLAVSSLNNTVTPQDAMEMASLTPTERLEWLAKRPQFSEARPIVSEILALYDKFLDLTGAPEEELVRKFSDAKLSDEHMQQANALGDKVGELLSVTGKDSVLYRHLIV